ncbi:MAG: LysR family transcriptional regulator [Polyangiales bacterium]|nr:LysR family transcriptional regulator [Myxococcales bacterium]MCB9661599.1 LysR family transcriptional regulator [Sandaracinaceae bacterium]
MLDWDDVRYLLAVTRRGTLAAAARSAKTNPTTVGRRVAQLEDKLGVRLFDRTARGWIPTEPCKRLLPHAERMELEALALARASAATDADLVGPVHMTTTGIVAARYLTPLLPRLRLRHPGIELRITCTERRLRLDRGEADLALRIARPEEPDVVARRVMRVPLALHGTSEYLERRGRPNPGSSYADHDLVAFLEGPGSEPENAWLEQNCPDARVVLRTNSVAVCVEALREGLGLGLIPRLLGDRDPRLVRLDTYSPPAPREVWLVYHQDIEPSPRVRALIDFLVQHLAD